MGYAANYADVISNEEVANLCPLEHTAFMDILKENEMDLDMFGCNLAINEGSGVDVEEAYGKLCQKFEDVTGIQLSLGYHSKDDGDRYDEVLNAFWQVDGMYQLTEAGKKLDYAVERRFFVTFG